MTRAGSIAAASDDVEAWLRPWVKDQCEGATVDEVLGLLAAAARDASLYDWKTLARKLVVHPGEFIRYNQGHLAVTHERGDTWILRHDDERLPVRLQLGEDTCELVGPVVDDASLRGVARRSMTELDRGLDAASGGAWRPPRSATILGAALDDVLPRDRPVGEGGLRVLEPDEDSTTALLALIATYAGDAAASTMKAFFASPFAEDWFGYVAVEDDRPRAAIIVGGSEGNDGVVWIGAEPGDPAVRLLVHTALYEGEPGVVTSTVTAEAARDHDLASLAYRALA